jgi:hypothetical protein
VCWRCSIGLQSAQERHEISALLVREDESQKYLVVDDDIFERRRDPVVEVRRARGKSSQRGRLEAAEIIPEARDIAAPSVRQLPDFTRRTVSERIQRQVRCARFG